MHRWAPVCEAVSRLLSPHGEVVLHDPETDTILAIWNSFSGRAPGDASLLAELDEMQDEGNDVFGPYPKSLPDGRQLSSVSAVLRDDSGLAEAVLCINFDRTVFEDASRLIAAFAAPVQRQPRELFEQDWIEGIHRFVGDYVRETGTSIERLSRSDRRTLLARLDASGTFGRQRSIPATARILNMSRSSVYTLLAEVRKEEKGQGHAS